MNIDIKYNPSYALAIVNLEEGEQIKAEGGAMVSMSSNISMETNKAQQGGLLKSLKTAMLGGESFWMNTFTPQGGAGEVTLAPTLPGDVKLVQVNGSVFVQSGSFLACHPSLSMDTQFQGLKGFFSGESLFFLKLSGNGDLLLSSYGGIEEIDVSGEFTVDTGHIVAFTEGLTYQVKRIVGGIKAFLFSGEGLVANFSGNGKVWIQSRNVPDLTSYLRNNLPPKKQ